MMGKCISHIYGIIPYQNSLLTKHDIAVKISSHTQGFIDWHVHRLLWCISETWRHASDYWPLHWTFALRKVYMHPPWLLCYTGHTLAHHFWECCGNRHWDSVCLNAAFCSCKLLLVISCFDTVGYFNHRPLHLRLWYKDRSLTLK